MKKSLNLPTQPFETSLKLNDLEFTFGFKLFAKGSTFELIGMVLQVASQCCLTLDASLFIYVQLTNGSQNAFNAIIHVIYECSKC